MVTEQEVKQKHTEIESDKYIPIEIALMGQ